MRRSSVKLMTREIQQCLRGEGAAREVNGAEPPLLIVPPLPASKENES